MRVSVDSARPFMIAVTGGSGSGKTTLARALLARLGDENCSLVTEDNYYLPRDRHSPPVVGWPNEAVEASINFDDPRSKDMDLMATHLAALRSGAAVEQPVYDFSVHDRVAGRHLRVEPRAVTVIEGLHVLSNPDFGAFFDLRIFVETSEDLRLIRRIRRDCGERGRDVESVLQQYLRFVRTAHQRYTQPAKYICDLVIADEGPSAVLREAPDSAVVRRLLAPVLSRLSEMGVLPPERG
jgi:uridine kinase